MKGARVTRGWAWAWIWIAGLAGAAVPAGAASAAPTAPTHVAVFDSVASRVARDLVPDGAIPRGRQLTLAIPLPGDTLSLLEQRLLERLRRDGVAVRLAGAALTESQDPAGEAAGATSPGSGGGESPLRLEARVESRRVAYLRRIGRFPLGTKGYERLVILQAQSRLVNPETGEVLWARSGSERAVDMVRAGDVEAVASSGSGMFRPTLPPRGGLRFLEPVIVAGVVVGLVVLFYSNRT